MKDTIRFKGLTLNRDEYSTENGEMSLCGGVEVHEGALRPSVLQGSSVNEGKNLPGKLVHVHKTDDYEMFITLREVQITGPLDTVWCLCAYKAGTAGGTAIWDGAAAPMTGIPSGVITLAVDFEHMKSIKSLGNILVVMNDRGTYEGIHYFACRNTGSLGGWRYEYVGQKPPFIELQFNLEPNTTHYPNDWYTYYLPPNTDFFDPDIQDNTETINPEITSAFTEHVMGCVNERIDTLAGEGRFYAPFLIRYCYRMYDGSIIMHSAPVLMMPMLHHPVMTFCSTLTAGMVPGTSAIWWKIFAQECALYVRCLNANNIVSQLEPWKGLIRSVDIFITPQFSRIDTSKMIEKVGANYTETNYALYNGFEPDIPGLFKATYDPNDIWSTNLISFVLPEYTENEYFARIKKASYFYKLATINVEDIQSKIIDAADAAHLNFAELEFDNDVLKNIAVQDQMRDDYKMHNELMTLNDKEGGMYVYNNRLNLYGLSERLFRGFKPQLLFPYVTSLIGTEIETRVYINTDSGVYAVKTSDRGNWSNWLLTHGYVFYPDARAEAISFIGGAVNRRLTPSDELNASISFMDDSLIDDLPTPINTASGVISNDLAVVPILNKVYTSKADNPFNFNIYPGEAAINTMGNGEVLGMAVVTRALASGSVGSHELIAFCTDGIWVMEVSASGTYSGLRNISREVSINPEAICQLDQSVIFATNRALNRFVQQDVISLTEVLDGPYFDIKDKLKAFSDVYCYDPPEGEPYPEDYDEEADALIRFNTAPSVYYKNSKVLYDYQSRRLILVPADTTNESIALVYSLLDETWSTMVLPSLVSVVNFYPAPYVQLRNVLASFECGPVLKLNTPYNYGDQNLHTGVVVTRTMAWSDSMDVIRGFRQYTDAEHMPMLYFFGSNDQRTWKYIGNSERSFHNYIPGHPYRFFRIAMYLRLHTSEKYQALALEVINKYLKL